MGQDQKQESGPGQEQGTEQKQGQYAFKYVRKRVDLTYQMTDYLHFSMEGTRKSVEIIWKRPFHKIPLEELFKKSRQGNPMGNLFLTYLYLDKRLENRYGEKYASFLAERNLTDEEMDRIQTFLQEKPIPYEWNFIEGWLTFLSLWIPFPQFQDE